MRKQQRWTLAEVRRLYASDLEKHGYILDANAVGPQATKDTLMRFTTDSSDHFDAESFAEIQPEMTLERSSMTLIEALTAIEHTKGAEHYSARVTTETNGPTKIWFHMVANDHHRTPIVIVRIDAIDTWVAFTPMGNTPTPDELAALFTTR